MKIYISFPFDKDTVEAHGDEVRRYVKGLQFHFKDEDLKLLYLSFDEATGDQGEALRLALAYMSEADFICFCPYYNDDSRCNRSAIEYRIATTMYSSKLLSSTTMENILAEYVQRPTVTVGRINEYIRDVDEDTLVYIRVGNTEFTITNIITEPFKSGFSKIIINTRPNEDLEKCVKGVSTYSAMIERMNKGEYKND